MDLDIIHSPKSNNSMNIEKSFSPRSSELSDWETVSHKELELSLPSISSTRASKEVNTIHVKHKKIIKQISEKVINIVKSTIREINHESVHFVVVMVMNEVSKVGLKNYEKKQLAKLIVVYILDCFAFSHIVNYYTVELIDNIIEMCYYHGLHTYKKNKKSSCCCF